MTKHIATVRININPDRGSAVIYIKKEFAQKLKFPTNTDLRAEYDDGIGEHGKLEITDL